MRAKEDCVIRLSTAKAPFIDILCDQSVEAAIERFDNIFVGYRPHPAGRPVATGHVGDRLIVSPEEADPEIPSTLRYMLL